MRINHRDTEDPESNPGVSAVTLPESSTDPEGRLQFRAVLDHIIRQFVAVARLAEEMGGGQFAGAGQEPFRARNVIFWGRRVMTSSLS